MEDEEKAHLTVIVPQIGCPHYQEVEDAVAFIDGFRHQYHEDTAAFDQLVHHVHSQRLMIDHLSASLHMQKQVIDQLTALVEVLTHSQTLTTEQQAYMEKLLRHFIFPQLAVAMCESQTSGL
jgi:hypothetical protein